MASSTTWDWRLPQALCATRVYDMAAVCPRPVEELGPHSAYLWAHPDDIYRRVVRARGGAPPHCFEMIDGPEGAAIGEAMVIDAATGRLLIPHDCGVVTWRPRLSDEGATVWFHIRIYDQDYDRGERPSAPLDMRWPVTVRARKFLALRGDIGIDGDGTLDRPYNNWSSFWRDESDATHAGKIVRVLGGDFGDCQPTYSITAATKPVAYIANPGESPRFHNVRWTWTGDRDGHSDSYVAGITQIGGSGTSAHYMNWYFGQSHRIVRFDNDYERLEAGENPSGGGGFDNPSAHLFNRIDNADGSCNRRHVALIANRAREFGPRNNDTANGPTLYTAYHHEDSLYEANSAINCDSHQVFFVKGRHRRTTVRYEYAPDGELSLTGSDEAEASSIVAAGDNEACYCTVGRMEIALQAERVRHLGHPLHFYRNTVRAGWISSPWGRQQDVRLSANLGAAIGDVPAWTRWRNVEAYTLDDSGQAQGLLRDDYRGRVGAALYRPERAGRLAAAATPSVCEFTDAVNQRLWRPEGGFVESADSLAGVSAGTLRPRLGTRYALYGAGHYGDDQAVTASVDAVGGASTVSALRRSTVVLYLHYRDDDNCISVRPTQARYRRIAMEATFRAYGASHSSTICMIDDSHFNTITTFVLASEWEGDSVTLRLAHDGVLTGEVVAHHPSAAGVPGVALDWRDSHGGMALVALEAFSLASPTRLAASSAYRFSHELEVARAAGLEA